MPNFADLKKIIHNAVQFVSGRTIKSMVCASTSVMPDVSVNFNDLTTKYDESLAASQSLYIA